FGGATREDDFFCRRADRRRDGGPSRFDGLFRLTAENMVPARRIAVPLSEIGEHRFDHARIHARGRVVVHVDRKFRRVHFPTVFYHERQTGTVAVASAPVCLKSSRVDLDRVYHGDCIEGLAGCPAEFVDLVFADPPFNIGYEYDHYDDRRHADHYLDWTRNWGKAVKRVLKPHGTFWLAIGDEYAAELKLIFQ